MFIDTHAHLFWDSFRGDVDSVVKSALERGVEKIVIPSVDVDSAITSIDIARRFKGVVYVAVGIHPEAVTEYPESDVFEMVDSVRELISRNRDVVVGVGEIGLDMHTKELSDAVDVQLKLFKNMLDVAIDSDLPVIVHTRNSFSKTVELIDFSKVRGVFHCFSNTENDLNVVLDSGFFVSFCGNVTWSKRVRRLLSKTPLNRLLLETDSPFMSPRDEQGNVIGDLRNEPKNVSILAEVYSAVKNEPIDVVAKATTDNATTLFRFDN